MSGSERRQDACTQAGPETSTNQWTRCRWVVLRTAHTSRCPMPRWVRLWNQSWWTHLDLRMTTEVKVSSRTISVWTLRDRYQTCSRMTMRCWMPLSEGCRSWIRSDKKENTIRRENSYSSPEGCQMASWWFVWSVWWGCSSSSSHHLTWGWRVSVSSAWVLHPSAI